MLNRNYTLLWFGQLVSQVGNRLYLMALVWYFVSVLDYNNGMFFLFIFSSLPSLLLGIFAGPLIERWNKKYIIIVCDVISGILTAVLASLVYNESASTGVIYAICFALNTVNIFLSPSVNSIVPAIIKKDQLQKGMSYMKMITFLGQILGAATGGVLVGLVGVFATILINSVSFFISALSGLFIEYKEVACVTIRNYKKDIKEGLKYVTSNMLVSRVLIIALGCNLFLPALIVIIPIIIENEMGLDALHYGLVDAMLPVGAVLMSIWIAHRRPATIKPLKVLAKGIIGVALCFWSIALIHSYVLVMFSVLLYGFFTSYINIKVVTHFISTVEEGYRGRFFSILESLSYATISLAYVLSGIISNEFEPYTSLAINGGGLFVLSAIAIFWNRKQIKLIKQ